ncbi:hypothetical protein [Mangrovimonas futianensis]|uniref:hypothetical protein n=1 Tax=Mangrovimonas futianensis TaxID=2895523 RepID=UPI001E28B987|nr:hypothetical protein [Mangrovimonas futianensis]MCF1421038.1 hypothetical protein [Mangrovimonas futianensis]
MTTEALTNILESNKIDFKVDYNPTPEKVSKIQVALERKSALMKLAIDAYKQVRRVG